MNAPLRLTECQIACKSVIVKDHCLDMLLFDESDVLGFSRPVSSAVASLSFSVARLPPVTHLYIFSSPHQLIFFPHSSFQHFFSFLVAFETFFCLVLMSLFPCFFILTTMLVCDWLWYLMWRHVPPTWPLASRLQWAALSGVWVRALPPQALQLLAGCTGAFPGQVPSTTCVPPLLQKTPGVVYFFSLAQYSDLPAQTGSDI